MVKRLWRKYSMPDEVLLVRAQTQIENLTKDLSAFHERFPWITSSYIDTYQADVDMARSIAKPAELKKTARVLSKTTTKAMADANKALRYLYKYAVLAFPDDKERMRAFGQDRFKTARNNRIKLNELLLNAHSVASKITYKASLLDKGYKQVNIDELLTLADHLSQKNKKHKEAQTENPATTKKRIELNNIVFDYMPLINKCAQVVFMRNPEAIKKYRIYP